MEGYYCIGGASVPNPTSMYSSDIFFFWGDGEVDTFKLFKKRKKSNVFFIKPICIDL